MWKTAEQKAHLRLVAKADNDASAVS